METSSSLAKMLQILKQYTSKKKKEDNNNNKNKRELLTKIGKIRLDNNSNQFKKNKEKIEKLLQEEDKKLSSTSAIPPPPPPPHHHDNNNKKNIELISENLSDLNFNNKITDDICYHPPIIFENSWTCSNSTDYLTVLNTSDTVSTIAMEDTDQSDVIGYHELKKVQNECVRLENTNNDLLTMIQHIEQENETLLKKIDSIKKANQLLAKENSDYMASSMENRQLEKDMNELKMLVHNLQEGIDEKNKSFYKLQEELQQIIRERTTMEKEKMHYTLTSISVGHQLDNLTKQKESLEQLKDDHFKKKMYVNRLQVLKGTARVLVFIRNNSHNNKNDNNNANNNLPTCSSLLLQGELLYVPTDDKICLRSPISPTKSIILPLTKKTTPTEEIITEEEQQFQFNKIFSSNEKLETIMEEISPVLKMALSGYNVCCLTYGQSGTGKSHLLLGGNNQASVNDSVIFKSFTLLLQTAERDKSKKYKFVVSMMEIYQENLFCLLSKSKISLRDLGNSISINGQKEITIYSQAELRECILKAKKHRHQGEGKLNKTASYSHFIFMVKIFSKSLFYDGICKNVMIILDLAGFERLNSVIRMPSAAAKLSHSYYTNKSLEALHHVMECLKNGQSSPPFRTSLLTHFLKPCFTGDAILLMLLMVNNNAKSYQSALQTLKFGNLAMNTSLGVPQSHKTL